ncbi:HSF_DOMAIN domain-containing protein [Caerostris extrusa]|uniref:HSF_DOMAIN domain-containing protein n=1 Tax=Caerostris extrusa TaxID=172846 RepID=A0AAV4PPM2_CAEEX|nr:HSF_DOMAIN domain-containing protein [Caerostris extrusa]
MVKFKKFQHKLWRVLNTCRSGAVRWSEIGDSIIFDFDKFKKEYLEPNNDFCKSSNVSSFIRQLNLYGFKKMVDLTRTSQANYGEKEYFNDNFIKGRNDLLKRVVRNPAKVSIPSLTEDDYIDIVVKIVPPKPERKRRNQSSVLQGYDSPTASPSTSANSRSSSMRWLFTEDKFIDVVNIVPPKPQRKRRNQDSVFKSYDNPTTSPSTSANFDPMKCKSQENLYDSL